jgi:signal peptidase
MPNRLARTAALVVAVAVTVAAATHGIVVVNGGSMEPSVRPGDLCVYRRCSAAARGEVVVFEDRGTLVVHRVVLVDRRGTVFTKGDANPTPDASALASSALRGRVVAVVPLGSLLAGSRPSAADASRVEVAPDGRYR